MAVSNESLNEVKRMLGTLRAQLGELEELESAFEGVDVTVGADIEGVMAQLDEAAGRASAWCPPPAAAPAFAIQG